MGVSCGMSSLNTLKLPMVFSIGIIFLRENEAYLLVFSVLLCKHMQSHCGKGTPHRQKVNVEIRRIL